MCCSVAEPVEIRIFTQTQKVKQWREPDLLVLKKLNKKVCRQRGGSAMLNIYGYQQDPAEVMLEGLKEGLPWFSWK
ncbi:MAG: hypothetical protein ACI8ZB_004288 [Desulforhopalus sp.]|jgi:hypothetical protein